MIGGTRRQRARLLPLPRLPDGVVGRGRERVYRLELGPLAAIEEFIARLRRDRAGEWERRLMALETEVHRVRREAKRRHAATRVVEQRRDREKEEAG